MSDKPSEMEEPFEEIIGQLMDTAQLSEITGYSQGRLTTLMRRGRVRGVFDPDNRTWTSSLEEVDRYRTEKRYKENPNPEMRWRRNRGLVKPLKSLDELPDYAKRYTREDIEGELKDILELAELTGYSPKHLRDLCRDGSIRAVFAVEGERGKWRSSVEEVEHYRAFVPPLSARRQMKGKTKRGPLGGTQND